MFDETDSIASHVDDTLIAGAGLCDKEAVEFIAGNARHCVQWLIDQGVLFDTEVNAQGEAHYHLTREGGHSHRRILHAADATGKEVETTLVGKASAHPNICVMERRNAVDLITSNKIGLPGTRRVVGAYVWNRELERVETYRAKTVVLATGGAAKVYQYTTNPDISSGDGIAMAGAPAAGSPTRVQPVPPDLPVPSAGAQLPADRSATRRRGLPEAPGRQPLYAGCRPTRRTGPARYRRPRHRP